MITRNWIRGLLFTLSSTVAFADRLPPPVISQASTDTVTSPSSKIPPYSFFNNFVNRDLLDQNGMPFKIEKLYNKVVLFNFIFTNCGSVCPIQTKALVEVMGALPMDLRAQVHFVSVSIDPKNDTPEKMLAFSKAMKANLQNWDFLTGKPEQIVQLSKNLLIFNEGEEGKPEIHRTSLWMVDKQGRMLQRYRGDPPEKERLIKALKQVSHLTIK